MSQFEGNTGDRSRIIELRACPKKRKSHNSCCVLKPPEHPNSWELGGPSEAHCTQNFYTLAFLYQETLSYLLLPSLLSLGGLMTAVTQRVLSTCGDKECYGGILSAGVRIDWQRIRALSANKGNPKNLSRRRAKAVPSQGTPNH